MKNGTNFSATDTAAPVRGLRPTRGARCLTVKAPKPLQLHPVAAGQRLDDLVEDDVDDALDVAVIEMLVGRGNFLNELGLDHRFGLPTPTTQSQSHCIASSFRTLPNRDKAVKAQAGKVRSLSKSPAMSSASARPEQARQGRVSDMPKTPQSTSRLGFQSMTLRSLGTLRLLLEVLDGLGLAADLSISL